MIHAEKKLLMIVGMHRSGTSAVGRLMQAVGLEFGNNLLEAIRSINDAGFWEDKEVVSLNQHIFKLYGFDWFDYERLPGKWWEEDRVKELIGVAETWYSESLAADKPAAVKDPRFCRLLPFWKRVFGGMDLDVKVLFVFRNPIEVAASLKKRDGFPLQVGYLLWLSYAIDALYYSRNMDLTLLHYEDLLAQTPKSLRAIHSLVDSLGVRVDNLSSCIADSIQIEMRHQKHELLEEQASVSGDVKILAQELYEELLDADSETAKGLADKYRKRFYRILDHHHEFLSALREGIASRVAQTQALFRLGEDHARALSVIQEKDSQLEENKGFINRCLEEIKNKDSLLEKKETTATDSSGVESYIQKFDFWMEDMKRNIENYREQIEQQKLYITECEAKIASQEKGLADNQEYIAKCHARIAEQDAGIAENRGYITACEQRIRVQDESLQYRDRILEEKNSRLLELEGAIVSLREAAKLLEIQINELQEKNAQQHDEIFTQESRAQEYAKTVYECQNQLRDLRSDLDAYKEKVRQQEELLIEKHKKIEFLEITVYEHKEKYGERSEKLRSIEAAFKLSDQKKAALESTINEQKKLIDQQSERILGLEGELQSAQEECRQGEREFHELKIQLSERSERLRLLEEYMSHSREQISQMEETLMDKQRLIGELSSRVEATESQLVSAQETSRRCDVLARDLQKQVFEKEQIIAERERFIEQKKGEYTDKLRTTETLLASSYEDNNRLQVTMQDLRLQLGERSERIRGLEESVSLYREHVSQHEMSLLARQQQIGELLSKISALEGRMASVNEESAKKDSSLNELKLLTLALERKITDSEMSIARKMEEHLDAMREIEGALAASRQDNYSLRDALQALQSDLGERDEKISGLEVSLHSSREAIANGVRQLEDLRDFSSQKQRELAQLEALVSDKNSEIESLRQRVDSLAGRDRVTQQHLALQKQQFEKLKAHAAALETEVIALQTKHKENAIQLEKYRSSRIIRTIDMILPEKDS